ncbi:LacI family DNA-binding transcriptional regulator [Glaciihabitans sp. dw_435]|uniref:LacI family DNA-binding transcriptional regulator n=1 Tax=Glaciihabitans sp. dw_435 TaxID=2720081 RepID=UPI001BD56014|nr:LacI family DNA-binding transcriptional regulator [Glaciihabitans sp. dw_435]
MGPSHATSYDVAREAGVSQSTVSRALRNDPRVSLATRERIREIADTIHYVPNLAAQSLITGHSRSIAVFVADLQNPVYPQLVDAVQSTLSERGYRMLLLSDSTEGSREGDLDALRGGLVAGTLFMQARVNSTLAEDLLQQGLPLVVVSRDVTSSKAEGIDRFVADSSNGGVIIADYLHALGHRRIAAISGPEYIPSILRRDTSFRTRLAELGNPLDESLVRRGPIEHATGLTFGTELLSLPDRPTVIYCGTDYIAFGAIDAANRLGVRIPEDVQVIGYDDLAMASWSMFNLTTVRQPLTEMAVAGTHRLIDRIEGTYVETPERVMFPVNLVERGTTAQLS